MFILQRIYKLITDIILFQNILTDIPCEILLN